MATKKPSVAQLRARAAFTKMVKERARLRAAGKLPPVKRTAKAAKVKHKTGKPSPAQLAARAKFVAMVRARSKAKKKTNSRGFSTRPPSWVSSKTVVRKRRKRNPGIIKMSEAQFARYGSKIRTSAPRKRTTVARRKLTGGRRRKAPSRGMFTGFRLGRAVGRSTKSAYKGVRSVGAGLWHGLKNPAGLPAKYERMYQHVLDSSGSKSIAAATVQKELKRQNPSLFSRFFGGSKKKKVAKVGYRKTQRGRRRYANPAPAKVFTEFRGREVRRRTPNIKAANGTPSTLAQLGRLRELKLKGKTLKFRAGHLAADGRKHLHVVGVRFKSRVNPGGEVDYGEIISVTYEADKPGVQRSSGDSPTAVFNYIHKFEGTRPRLIVDEEGYGKIEGGSYAITADGIEG